jgi:hypothetical protein
MEAADLFVAVLLGPFSILLARLSAHRTSVEEPDGAAPVLAGEDVLAAPCRQKHGRDAEFHQDQRPAAAQQCQRGRTGIDRQAGQLNENDARDPQDHDDPPGHQRQGQELQYAGKEFVRHAAPNAAGAPAVPQQGGLPFPAGAVRGSQ